MRRPDQRLVVGLGGGALAAAILLGVALAGWFDALSPADVVDRIAALGVWGWLVVVALMIVHCFVFFPAEIVAVAAGLCFGVALGTALVWLGAMLGAALSFALARRLGRPFVERVLSPSQLAALDRRTGDPGAAVLLGARLMPVISFNLVNYAAGLTRTSWPTFLWTTGVGILPLTVAMVAAGHWMQALEPSTLLAVTAGGLALLAGAVLVARLPRRQHTPATGSNGTTRRPSGRISS